MTDIPLEPVRFRFCRNCGAKMTNPNIITGPKSDKQIYRCLVCGRENIIEEEDNDDREDS